MFQVRFLIHDVGRAKAGLHRWDLSYWREIAKQAGQPLEEIAPTHEEAGLLIRKLQAQLGVDHKPKGGRKKAA